MTRITNLAAVFLALMAASVHAQEQTLVGSGIESGGFGGPVFRVTTFDGEARFLAGGRGGWIINHRFVLGGGGYGSSTGENRSTSLGVGRLDFGYGGLEMEYIFRPSQLVHGTLTTHFGAGAVNFDPEGGGDDDDDNVTDQVFVFEPGVSLELNVTTFFRIGLGGSYRGIVGIDLAGISESDFAGPAFGVTLKFGKF